MKIRVPGTSANLGCGFDSCGIALTLYLHVEVIGPSKTWLIEHHMKGLAQDESNLVIQTALRVKPDLSPYHLKMSSDIPTARGLGSSSSAIAAGIEVANRLGQMGLTDDEKVKIATEIEGHPDNVAPAILGSLTVSSYGRGKIDCVNYYFPDCDCVVFIPTHELLTSESREVLPSRISYKEAVEASAISNVMVAALMKGDLSLAGKMMEKDLFHEKYREKLVPHLTKIREIGHKIGAYGTVLSGAGPTVLTLCPSNHTQEFVAAVNAVSLPGKVEVYEIDNEGVQVF